MKYRNLGHSDLNVSRICLGTMTFGYQNTVEDAGRQLDMALEHGVNFLDTAEAYPVPPTADKAGRTESFIGEWIKSSGKRDEYMIATKMTGPGRFMRDGRGLNPADVAEAVDGSLKRLGVDVIDLYQLHWPQRQVNFFAQRDFQPDKHVSTTGEDIEGMLAALAKEIEKGKIRYIGVSNETPWGIMQYLKFADQGLPRIVSSQNPYSLVQRNWDIHLGEFAMRERVDLLAYSPLAGGILTGKYLDGAHPEGARFSEDWGEGLMSMHSKNRDSAYVKFYADLARDNGMTPTQLAIAWVNQREHLGSNIIGATTDAQLKEALSAEEITLSSDVIEAIEDYHDQHPNPSLTRRGARDAG